MPLQNAQNPADFKPTFAHVAILGFTCSLGPFATNGIVTAFHALSIQFALPLAAMQEMLTVYLVALTLGSLLVGSFSDAFGRKPVLAGGMVLFAVASIAAVFSDALMEMNFWRALQGLGASVGQVVTQAMVRDRWNGLAATQAMSIIGMLFSVSPALAPVIGGWLVVWMGWKAVFWFLALYSLSIWAVTVFCLTETLETTSRRPLNWTGLVVGYAECLKNKAYFFGVASNGLNFMGMILVVAGGADFVVNVMGFGVDGFAWMSIPLVVSSILGSSMAPRVAQRFGTTTMVLGSLTLLVLYEAGMALGMVGETPGYVPTILLAIVFSFVGNLVRPVVMVMNLDYHPRRRGMAASIQQGFHTLGFALSSSVLVPLCIGAAWKYAVAMSISAALAGLFWVLSLHYRSACLPPKEA